MRMIVCKFKFIQVQVEKKVELELEVQVVLNTSKHSGKGGAKTPQPASHRDR